MNCSGISTEIISGKKIIGIIYSKCRIASLPILPPASIKFLVSNCSNRPVRILCLAVACAIYCVGWELNLIVIIGMHGYVRPVEEGLHERSPVLDGKSNIPFESLTEFCLSNPDSLAAVLVFNNTIAYVES